MEMVKRAYNFMLEQELKLTFINEMVSIKNYNELINFDNKNITIKNKISVTVYGNNLVISKLLYDEILISGKIEGIEFK